MKNTIVITSIYSEFWGTKEFKKSCKRVGLQVYNAFTGGTFTGNGDVMRMIYNAYVEVGKRGYDKAIYSDGADTVFLKAFEPPDDKVIFSAEKACYPRPELATQFPETSSPWKYLNGGNACGPVKLLVEFYERYGLNKYKGDVNGQYELSLAFLQALKDGFPIELDTQCEYFQTTAFEEPGDFFSDGIIFRNCITNTEPHCVHGNGRSDLSWIYANLNK